jgi:hypothetical protein
MANCVTEGHFQLTNRYTISTAAELNLTYNQSDESDDPYIGVRVEGDFLSRVLKYDEYLSRCNQGAGQMSSMVTASIQLTPLELVSFCFQRANTSRSRPSP